MGDDELGDLLDRVNQIDELTETVGWAFYVDALKSFAAIKQNLILGGSLGSLEEYKRHIGFCDGIRAAIDAPRLLRDRIERQRDQVE